MTLRIFISCFLLSLIFSCSSSSKPPLDPKAPSPEFSRSYFNTYWAGELKYDYYHLPFAFDIDSANARIHNPAQGVVNLKADSVKLKEGTLQIYSKNISFELLPMSTDRVMVTLVEGSSRKEFDVQRNAKLANPLRPQTPDFASSEYLIDTITFYNEIDDITLAGTLTSPKGSPSAAAILLTGSGPQDRDETILHHKSFAVIADHLTKQGMIVLRFDDRGTARSEGSHTFATSRDFAKDAETAHNYLKSQELEIPIGFIGHSEGGMIAQIADSLLQGVDFHIYLASPGIEIKPLMLEQNRQVLKNYMKGDAMNQYIEGLSTVFDIITSEEDISSKQKKINNVAKSIYNALPDEAAAVLAPSDMVYAMSLSQLMYLPWWPYFLSYVPKTYLSRITCPILALNGAEDIQVTVDNLEAIQTNATLSDVTTYALDSTNHLFQKCNLCNLNEYGMLTETFSTEALHLMTSWLSEKGFINKE